MVAYLDHNIKQVVKPFVCILLKQKHSTAYLTQTYTFILECGNNAVGQSHRIDRRQIINRTAIAATADLVLNTIVNTIHPTHIQLL